MIYLIYFIIVILATTLGSMTGMGGGIIIKPVLDLLGHTDAASISMLSSITVLVMAAVSLWRQRRSADKPERTIALPFALGAVLGGSLGSLGLNALLADAASSGVTVVQNIVLAVLVAATFLYMLNKGRIQSRRLKGVIPSAAAGLILGAISSFLGIGGGPINVVLIIYLFSLTTKTAALCSLLSILLSQASKLLLTLFLGGFAGYDLSMLPIMLAAAIAGGLLGGTLNKRMDEKATDRLFNMVQILVFCLCMTNIWRNL